MCKIGDIILVDNYKDNGCNLNKHSFIVIEDENGTIEGVPYDFICNVMSSFKNDEQKLRKLRYPGNFPISHNDTVTDPHNNRDGFVKTDQLYYFKKDNINFKVIGNVIPEVLDMIFDFIENSDFEFSHIIDNL
nr:MAG TPA: endoribonuclease [Caudoviricetes sp.]